MSTRLTELKSDAQLLLEQMRNRRDRRMNSPRSTVAGGSRMATPLGRSVWGTAEGGLLMRGNEFIKDEKSTQTDSIKSAAGSVVKTQNIYINAQLIPASVPVLAQPQSVPAAAAAPLPRFVSPPPVALPKFTAPVLNVVSAATAAAEDILLGPVRAVEVSEQDGWQQAGFTKPAEVLSNTKTVNKMFQDEDDFDFDSLLNQGMAAKPVSYTHLTLPTIYSV